MSVNPPEHENFSSTETVIPEVVVETPNHDNRPTVYLGDLQAVQLELNSAAREGRKPKLKQFSPEAVKAAGWNPSSSKPVEVIDPENEGGKTPEERNKVLDDVAAQTPIVNQSGQLNVNPSPGLNEQEDPNIHDFSGSVVEDENDDSNKEAETQSGDVKPEETKSETEKADSDAPKAEDKPVAVKAVAKKAVAKKAATKKD